MPLPPLQRLPAVPSPDLPRIFGRRDGPPRRDPVEAALLAAARVLDLDAIPLPWLRLACTDPGWVNEAQTPAWRPVWPDNTPLAAEGLPLVEDSGVDAAALGEAAGLWPALWLSPGQRMLGGTGRATVLARAVAALTAVVDQTGGDAEAWLRAHAG